MLATRPTVPVPSRTPFSAPTLWIHPAANEGENPLSADVECLKWQAYIALRNLTDVQVRTNISPAGAIDGRLPNLLVSETTLLAAHHIPQWVDQQQQTNLTDSLEGYKDDNALDESRAWVSLLEGTIHAALLVAVPAPSYLNSLLSLKPSQSPPIQCVLTPPPAPLTGLASLFPSFGIQIPTTTIFAQYRDAISALSERLGTDKWFLGSNEPTPLDALAFAYLHSITLSENSLLTIEVSRRVNLVAWEWRVRQVVREAFVANSS